MRLAEGTDGGLDFDATPPLISFPAGGAAGAAGQSGFFPSRKVLIVLISTLLFSAGLTV